MALNDPAQEFARGRRVPRRPHGMVLLLVAAAAVAVAVAAVVLWAPFSHFGPVSGTSLSTPQLASPSQISSWQNLSTPGATAFASNDTLWVHPGSPQLLVLMSPVGHDLTFMVNGLANPEIHLAAGTHVSLTIVNMDPDMYHNWVVTSEAPPYREYPMIGGGMMGGSYEMWGSSMMGEPQGGMYWSQGLGFTVTSTGHYWYLCTYPSHASDGMYGSFFVA